MTMKVTCPNCASLRVAVDLYAEYVYDGNDMFAVNEQATVEVSTVTTCEPAFCKRCGWDGKLAECLPRKEPANDRKRQLEMLKAYRLLHRQLSDMVEGGRLTEADCPDDYEAVVRSLTDIVALDPSNGWELGGSPGFTECLLRAGHPEGECMDRGSKEDGAEGNWSLPGERKCGDPLLTDVTTQATREFLDACRELRRRGEQLALGDPFGEILVRMQRGDWRDPGVYTGPAMDRGSTQGEKPEGTHHDNPSWSPSHRHDDESTGIVGPTGPKKPSPDEVS